MSPNIVVVAPDGGGKRTKIPGMAIVKLQGTPVAKKIKTADAAGSTST